MLTHYYIYHCKNYIVNILQNIQLLLSYVTLFVSCVMWLSGHIDISRSSATQVETLIDGIGTVHSHNTLTVQFFV